MDGNKTEHLWITQTVVALNSLEAYQIL